MAVFGGDNPRLSPRYNPVGALVRYGAGTDVTSVLVNGRLVVDEGRVLAVDEAELLAAADEVAARMRDHLLPRRYWPLTRRSQLL